MHAVFLLAALVAALALGSPEAQAQPARGADGAVARADLAVRAERLQPDERLTLDGRLDHPAWARAPVWDRFVETQPQAGAAPVQRTTVRVLFDDRAVWIGVQAEDTAPALIRDVPVRFDQVNRTQDFVVVYLDPIGTGQAAQFFRINAAGSLADGLHTAADDSEDFAPNFDWDGAAHRHESGWSAVFRIPFATLRYTEEAGGNDRPWRFMVARRLPRAQFHLLASVPIPRGLPSFIHNLQPLAGVALPEDHRFLTVRPSLTWRTERQGPAGGPSVRRAATEASLDVKWRPRAELVLDGTLNPDFSQVALDVPQLSGNTRFALFLPETRPFFFEGADLLRSPTDAVYTRSFARPRAGARATWRTAGLSATALWVDDRGDGLVLLPGAYGSDAAAQPASRTLVARGRMDGGAWQLGAVASRRVYEEGRGDNVVAGPDLAWQIDGAWRLRAQWLDARTTAQPDGLGGLASGPATNGRFLHAELTREFDRQETELLYERSGPGFRHDTGFFAQSGVERVRLFHAHGWGGVGPLNDVHVNLQWERRTAVGGGPVVYQDIRPGLWLTGPHNLDAWLELHPDARTRPAEGAALLRQRYVAGGVTFTPARWLPLLTTEFEWGRLADAEALAVGPGGRLDLTARWRPWRRLELDSTLSQAWLRREGRRTYSESAGQVLAVWHVDGRRSVRLIAQRTALERRAEPGIAAESSRRRIVSLTGTWRRSAGTVLYAGLNHERLQGPSPRQAAEAFLKLQVDADDLRPVVAWAAR